MGTINCEITGRRRYSRGIPQGGLEIPCRLIFEGLEKYVNMASNKLEKLKAKDKIARDALLETKNEAMNAVMQWVYKKTKQPKLCDVQGNEEVSIGKEAGENSEWVQIFAVTLKIIDRTQLLTGEQLTDVHINAAQKLLLYQFPRIILIQQCIGF